MVSAARIENPGILNLSITGIPEILQAVELLRQEVIMAVATKLGSGNASLPVYELDFANGQNVTIGGTSAQSTAIASEVARIFTTTDCYYAVGTDPTAVTNGASAYLPGGSGEYVGLKSGQKIAVIQVSGAGTLNIIPAVMR